MFEKYFEVFKELNVMIHIHIPYSMAATFFIIYLHSGDIDCKNFERFSFDL